MPESLPFMFGSFVSTQSTFIRPRSRCSPLKWLVVRLDESRSRDQWREHDKGSYRDLTFNCSTWKLGRLALYSRVSNYWGPYSIPCIVPIRIRNSKYGDQVCGWIHPGRLVCRLESWPGGLYLRENGDRIYTIIPVGNEATVCFILRTNRGTARVDQVGQKIWNT